MQSNPLCISLIPGSMLELKSLIPQITDADLVELRLDDFRNIDFNEIRSLIEKPVLITLRSPEEGGYFRGSAEERVRLFREALDVGIDYIDVEFRVAANILSGLNGDVPGKVVISHHTSATDQSDLIELLHEMIKVPAAVYKLIFTAESLADNLTALNLIEEARRIGVNYIIHAMGEAGKLSRIIGAIKGNAWTYVSLDGPLATAPGQVTLQEAISGYCLHSKKPQTRYFGLLGYPTAQSSGWKLHNRLYEIMKSPSADEENDFLYVNFETPELECFWKDWQHHIAGLSVTIPHKLSIVQYLTEVSPEVELSGVCNTAIKTETGWHGYNTDMLAIVDIFRPYRNKLANGSVLVVGTGATSRSAVAALQRLNLDQVVVTGRNVENGRSLAADFNIQFEEEGGLQKREYSGIVQTTPVGMVPHTNDLPVSEDLLRKGMVIFDVVYNPAETRLLSIARRKGAIALSGVEMFLRQAACQFQIFTGIPVSLEKVHEVWSSIT